uniref:VHS domain-containing protein n=1 Tax=Anisakis simplex TaxID=6269 RepID=A0A0M3KF05_ANISI
LLDVLNGRDWTVKYVVLSWFDECFEKPKRQIPEVLFKSISEERQHNFESICVNFDSAPVECFFRSIFELGVLSPQLANQFLDDGVSVKPADIELNVKIAMAFIDSMRVGTPNDRLLATCDVLDKLLNVLDPSLELNPVTFYNQSTVYGLRLVASLKILGDAVILTQRDVKKEPSRRNRDISEKLLSVWCQRAKSHIERELIDLRRSRLRYVPNIRDPLPIPDDVKIDRLCRVKTELAELFSIAVMISKCVDEDGTVYAFAKTSAHPSDLSAQTQVADPSAQTRTADPSDPSAQTQIPQAHAQFRTGAFGGENETAETIQAFRRNSDTDYENRQGFGQNNYYKDNRAQYDDHQHTSVSNTLFEMNSESMCQRFH